MAKFTYKGFRQDLVDGNVVSGADVRVLAVMNGSSAGTDEDAVNIDDITSLNEFDGSNYARLDLANVAVVSDDTNDRHEVTADDGSFGATVGAGSDEIIGFVYYRWVDGTAANDILWAFNDDGCPVDPNGGALDLTLPADGIVQIQS
jgi:hypothetical protein